MQKKQSLMKLIDPRQNDGGKSDDDEQRNKNEIGAGVNVYGTKLVCFVREIVLFFIRVFFSFNFASLLF